MHVKWNAILNIKTPHTHDFEILKHTD